MTPSPQLPNLLKQIAHRHATYLSQTISTEIAECDDMFVEGLLDHYMNCGVSAIEICIQAMILGRRERFGSILDLPCGGGRVTRHFKAFFHDAKLYAVDIHPGKQAFVVKAFDAQPIHVAADFGSEVTERFDLIFVGSLLTHLDIGDFERALRWFINSLAPMGILIVSTHGRNTAHAFRDNKAFRPALDEFKRTGFGFHFTNIESADGITVQYGGTWIKSSCLMRLIEDNPAIRILGFQEAVWDNNHDVLIVQRRPIP